DRGVGAAQQQNGLPTVGGGLPQEGRGYQNAPLLVVLAVQVDVENAYVDQEHFTIRVRVVAVVCRVVVVTLVMFVAELGVAGHSRAFDPGAGSGFSNWQEYEAPL